MKTCIVGAGAIGGFLAAKLAQAGEEVTVIARGAHLEAMQKNGLKFLGAEGEESVIRNLRAAGTASEAGTQDAVFLALKAHQIESVAPGLRAMFTPDTVVVTLQNGLPWWYFRRHGGEHEGRRLASIDPNGVIEASIEPDRIIGCVAYPAAEVVAPGVVRHVEGNRFPLGELDGSETERAKRLSEALTRAGFKAPVIPDIRAELWLKAWGNLSFNPISALTHATLVDICQNPHTRDLAASMMREAQEIAGKLGITFRVSLEKRISGAEKVGRHKTSMLQDVEAGKPLEVEALVGVFLELARLTGTPAPHIESVYACARLLTATMEAEGVCFPPVGGPKPSGSPRKEAGPGAGALRQAS
ncbi:MAG: 2-dehydropantoate 2-reductase [Betaproteobacteria bacterium]|nr:2-dehydropantoate 2-reductase [Betaproteobacteria bacterium]